MTRTARATLLLVIANLAVYLVMFAGWMLRGFFPELPEKMVGLLTFPGDPRELLFVPWTSVTYMFTQISFLHLTVNMLWLAGFGAMMKGDWWQTAGAYLAGGIAGAVAFSMYTIYAGLPGEHLAGASASVIAVVAATTILTPERRVRLLFIGDIRLKWVPRQGHRPARHERGPAAYHEDENSPEGILFRIRLPLRRRAARTVRPYAPAIFRITDCRRCAYLSFLNFPKP